MLQASLMALSFIQPEVWAIKVYIADIGIFYFFAPNFDLDPMTFMYELDVFLWRLHGVCKYEGPTSRLSNVIV